MPIITGLSIAGIFYYLYVISRIDVDTEKSDTIQKRVNILLVLSVILSLTSCSVVPMEKNSTINTYRMGEDNQAKVINSEYYGYGFITRLGGDDTSTDHVMGSTISKDIYTLNGKQYLINVLVSLILIPAVFYYYINNEKYLHI